MLPTTKRKHMKKLLANMLLAGLSLALILLFFEFIIFRHLLLASDMPNATFSNGLVHLVPGQRGVFREFDEIKASFRINEQGWNSGHPRYAKQRTQEKRIAIIGDSYVEALQVDFDKSVAEKLEKLLGQKHEVYRFGISGAPLSQYLHMLRQEVTRYTPDLVVVMLVHNDFDESYAFKAGTRASSFLKLRIEHGLVMGEIAPTSLKDHWYNPIRRSATWRYLAVRRGLRLQALRDMILGRDAPLSLEANIDTTRLEIGTTGPDPLALDRQATRYSLNEMKKLADSEGFRLLLVMDGVRSLIENGSPIALDYSRGALRLNKMVRKEAAEQGIPFLDLHPVFLADYGLNATPFAFSQNGHWNEYAHALVADALDEAITAYGLL